MIYYISSLKQGLWNVKTYKHNLLDGCSLIDRHRCHYAVSFDVFVDEDRDTLSMLYWIPRSYRSYILASSSS